MNDSFRYFPFSFPLSRKVWEQFDVVGILEDCSRVEDREFYGVRLLSERINQDPNRKTGVQPWISAGQLLTFGLLHDLMRFMLNRYCRDENPGSLEKGLTWTRMRKGPMVVDQTTRVFVALFPPQKVGTGQVREDDFLAGTTQNRSNRVITIPEIILLSMATANPALKSMVEFFDDTDFKKQSLYQDLLEGLEDFFDSQPPLKSLQQTLFKILRAPIRACPDSLEGQLEYILQHWAPVLTESLLRRVLITRGILQEERASRGPVGGGKSEILRFGDWRGKRFDGYPEPERFSSDLDWMSNVVLIAKSIYVWLDQLSRKYQRPITRLDEIPNEELDQLAEWGFNGLWLIGLWERSSASKKIKRIMGNPEAISSAYSLYDYFIAQDLGGEPALENLRSRAWQRRIRLTSDMVPNHVGLYSKWMIEHPEWFIQVDRPPFPGYQYNGPDLSEDHRVVIQVEDGYWSHRDAAVVFKRIDKQTGKVIYIYHGNDGTHLPWNDTAQLNYLLPQVREAVIQTILHVARMFPIIRFDAAMTLTKKHYQRLWFPLPGEGGAIPSRAEHGMTWEEFESHLPEEFWREVVDRIAAEAPDTLLLAEAFWLMEGYFVRTLGMHRVYNSAFMNMMKMEDNADYRTTIKNVLEFSPRVLKRFVNFMNNPDEKTAIEQFGKEDKYFGVSVMMVTMPGLPMFGHGQIEGFSEKYGMEYRRAYWDEPVDKHMVYRHEKEVFPLMRMRYLFSRVENFAFYDFHTPEGQVDENVFAYSNRTGRERAIILYNNAYNTTKGWIKESTAINAGCQEIKELIHKSLADSLDLQTDEKHYYIFREHPSGLEYLRRGCQLADEGFYVELHAYQYRVFLEFREIYDENGSWHRLYEKLEDQGRPSIQRTYREMILSPIHNVFREVIYPETLLPLVLPADRKQTKVRTDESRDRMTQALKKLLETAQQVELPMTQKDSRVESILDDFKHLQQFAKVLRRVNVNKEVSAIVLKKFFSDPQSEPLVREILAYWIVLKHLEPVLRRTSSQESKSDWMEEWLFTTVVTQTLAQSGRDYRCAYLDAHLLKALLRYPDLLCTDGIAQIQELLSDEGLKDYLGINSYQGVQYFNKEQFESLLNWILLTSLFALLTSSDLKNNQRTKKMENSYKILAQLCSTAEKSGYRVEDLIKNTRLK